MREASAREGKRLGQNGRFVRGGFYCLDEAASSFLFSGSSALLLLVADFFPHYWYLSFFALTPFLYRIVRVKPRCALQLGILFGLSFLTIRELGAFTAAPLTAALTITFGTALFAIFGWTIAKLKEKFGFNPLAVALLWVLFELVLVRFGTRTILSESEGSLTNFSTLFHGWAVLFGLLAVSFVIVLVNSILVFAIHKAIIVAKARGQCVWEIGRIWDLSPIPGLFAQKVYLVPEGRGPPVSE